jgi:hypothetical protein
MAAQDLSAIAFPKLTEEQMTQLASYAGASTKTFRAGEALLRAVRTGIELGDSPHLVLEAAAISIGNEPAGGIRSWRRAFRLSQTRRVRRRRRLDVGPVRSRVFENDVIR